MFLSTHCNAHSALDGQGDLHYLLIFLISREIPSLNLDLSSIKFFKPII